MPRLCLCVLLLSCSCLAAVRHNAPGRHPVLPHRSPATQPQRQQCPLRPPSCASSPPRRPCRGRRWSWWSTRSRGAHGGGAWCHRRGRASYLRSLRGSLRSSSSRHRGIRGIRGSVRRRVWRDNDDDGDHRRRRRRWCNHRGGVRGVWRRLLWGRAGWRGVGWQLRHATRK